MATESLIYIISGYLILVLGVVIAASRRRITLFKAFMISFFFTPVTGIIALIRTSRKVVVTHYFTQNRCTNCPHGEQPKPEVCEDCEFFGNLHKRLSVNRRYSI